MEHSYLDEILSPENFPPCDHIAAAARSELAALKAENEMLRSDSEELDDLKSDIKALIPYTSEPDGEYGRSLSAHDCVEAAAAELSRLRAKAQLADEIAALFRMGNGYPLRPLDVAWLDRFDRIENQEAGDAE